MLRTRSLAVVILLFCLAGFTPAADDAPALVTVHGMVDKVEKDVLTLKPRGADGRFGKNMTLKVTGTSMISTVTMQKRAGKLVPVQRSTDAKDLQPKQAIAIIYTTGAAGPVILAAVAQPE
jgi:hypothetical protein